MKKSLFVIVVTIAAFMVAGAAQAAGDAAKGKAAYTTYCLACHGPDPSVDGPAGPKIKGSAKGLLEIKMLKGAYPAGYKPARDTKIMPPMPHLAGEVDNLAAFLK